MVALHPPDFARISKTTWKLTELTAKRGRNQLFAIAFDDRQSPLWLESGSCPRAHLGKAKRIEQVQDIRPSENEVQTHPSGSIRTVGHLDERLWHRGSQPRAVFAGSFLAGAHARSLRAVDAGIKRTDR